MLSHFGVAAKIVAKRNQSSLFHPQKRKLREGALVQRGRLLVLQAVAAGSILSITYGPLNPLGMPLSTELEIISEHMTLVFQKPTPPQS